MTTFIKVDERSAAVILVAVAFVLLAIGAPGLFDQFVVGPIETAIDAITGAY
jgi:hypothetical protein